jgi:hypothetical protein
VNAHLVPVYAALQRGDRLTARQRLVEIVRSPGGQSLGEAWWLLAETLDDPAQQADCRRRAQAAGFAPPSGAAAAAGGGRPIVVAMPAPQPSSAPQSGQFSGEDYSADIEFVIKKLSDDMDRYELAKAVMVQRGWSFEVATSFVDYVEANSTRNVASQRLPLIVLVSMVGVVIGLLLACSGVITITDFRASGLAYIVASLRFIIGVAVVGGALWHLIKGLAALRA